jgi:hypothetical protein
MHLHSEEWLKLVVMYHQFLKFLDQLTRPQNIIVNWTGVYIMENTPPPLGGGGKYQPMSFGGKNMKRQREKGKKYERKRKEGERKRRKGERKWEKGK